MMTRRAFGTGLALAATVTLARPAVAKAKSQIVVIGGGPGGATAARCLMTEGRGAIDVTLVEPARSFVTCFHSNLVVGGLKSLAQITHGYDGLRARGVSVVHQAATAIDRDGRTVRLADGSVLAYDRLVVAPGIDLVYDSVPGYSRAAKDLMPHAWKAGPQTALIKAKLDAVPDGGLIVVVAPPNPYRCPPGPYERVSLMAHLLKSSGRGNAKIIILDPKDKFAKQGLFQEAWETRYPGMIEWLPPSIHDGVTSVDPKTGTIVTGFETYRNIALANVIPAQVAGRIARDAGLPDAGGYCPIDAATMRSRLDPAVYVLGDACDAGDMPKSAFGANSQAKVAAMTILGELIGARTEPARYDTLCWSLLAADDAVKVSGRYENRDGAITAVQSFVSQPNEPAMLRAEARRENDAWYDGFVAGIFG